MRSGIVRFFSATVGQVAAVGCDASPEGSLETELGGRQALTATAPIPMEVAVATNVSSGTWTTVNLERSYQSMVVVATSAYTETSVPLVTKIRNAAGNHFDIMVSRFDGRTGSVSPVPVSYLVMEEGAYSATQQGWTIEAKRFNSTVTDRAGHWSGQLQPTTNRYVSPVVVGQVMSYNDARPSVFWSRGTTVTEPASAAAVRVGKHIGEDSITTRKSELLGYVVAETASMKFGNLLVQAALGSDTVVGIPSGPTRYPLAYPGSGLVALLGQSGMDGNDGSWALLYGANATTGSDLLLTVDEDNMHASERSHAAEQVGYLAFTPRSVCPPGGCDPAACVPGYLGMGAIDGTVELGRSHSLTDLQGIWCITGDLNVNDAGQIDLSGLDALTTVRGGIVVANNPTLVTLKGLEQLRTAGSLAIWDNTALTSLASLGRLKTLGYGPSITNNPALPACWTWQIAQQTGNRCDYCQNNNGNGSCGTLPEGFVCQLGAIGPGVYDGNVRLDDWTRPNQFGGVTCITGDLVAWNSSLTDLTGLEQLVAVGGNVAIDNNPALVSVTGLENLKTATGLWINYNPVLTSLAGLTKLNSLRNDPSIYGNPLLPTCWAENVATQTGRLCACSGNTGEGVCQ